jgi:hypothetical protein
MFYSHAIVGQSNWTTGFDLIKRPLMIQTKFNINWTPPHIFRYNIFLLKIITGVLNVKARSYIFVYLKLSHAHYIFNTITITRNR